MSEGESSGHNVLKTLGNVVVGAMIVGAIGYGLYRLGRYQFRKGVLMGARRFRLVNRDRTASVRVGTDGRLIMFTNREAEYDRIADGVFVLVPGVSGRYAIRTAVSSYSAVVASASGELAPLYVRRVAGQAGLEAGTLGSGDISFVVEIPKGGDTITLKVVDADGVRLLPVASKAGFVEASLEAGATSESFYLECAGGSY